MKDFTYTPYTGSSGGDGTPVTPPTPTHTVTVDNGSFVLDATDNLYLGPGETMVFDQSDATNAGNKLTLYRHGTTENSYVEYTHANITYSGTPGTADAYLQVTYADDMYDRTSLIFGNETDTSPSGGLDIMPLPVSGQVETSVTITVTYSNGELQYSINGVAYNPLNFYIGPGQTFIFDQSDATNTNYAIGLKEGSRTGSQTNFNHNSFAYTGTAGTDGQLTVSYDTGLFKRTIILTIGGHTAQPSYKGIYVRAPLVIVPPPTPTHIVTFDSATDKFVFDNNDLILESGETFVWDQSDPSNDGKQLVLKRHAADGMYGEFTHANINYSGLPGTSGAYLEVTYADDMYDITKPQGGRFTIDAQTGSMISYYMLLAPPGEQLPTTITYTVTQGTHATGGPWGPPGPYLEFSLNGQVVEKNLLIIAPGQTLIFDQSDATNTEEMLMKTDPMSVATSQYITYTGTPGVDGQFQIVYNTALPNFGTPGRLFIGMTNADPMTGEMVMMKDFTYTPYTGN